MLHNPLPRVLVTETSLSENNSETNESENDSETSFDTLTKVSREPAVFIGTQLSVDMPPLLHNPLPRVLVTETNVLKNNSETNESENDSETSFDTLTKVSREPAVFVGVERQAAVQVILVIHLLCEALWALIWYSN